VRRSTEDGQDEVQRLKKQLQERDRQLKEQAASLADMESSLAELENMKGLDELGGHNRNGSGGLRDADSAQLRAIVREKNERIAMLTAEFDAHRADFRSTIDTLEMASTETERVYEKKVEELIAELRELQSNHEEVTGVTQQMKQVEEMVAELEEGLEDARRGEAEARAEVEFLRGEVERTRAELKQEREKSAEALKNAEAAVGSNGQEARDKEQMQDEIRGLRAIIHSLSSGGGSPVVERPGVNRSNSEGISTEEHGQMRANVERLEREKKELQGLIERKNFHEEQLEREVEKLKGIEQRGSVISNGMSDRTAVQDKRSSARDSKGTVVNWRGSSGRIEAMAPMAEADTHSVSTGSGVLWCEICETSGHDILTCTSIDKESTHGDAEQDVEKISKHMQNASISSQDPDKPKPLAMSLHKKPSIGNLPAVTSAPPNMPLPSPYKMNDSVAAGKDGTRDPSKWCALCERDGHDSINCSFEDQFG
jgi:DNA repair exonuclease SbcCD ATPase subunit